MAGNRDSKGRRKALPPSKDHDEEVSAGTQGAGWLSRMSRRRWTLTDLLLIAFLAALGLATKQVIYPMVSLVAIPLYLPTGAIAGGIYMMWLVVARGVVNRPGAALLCAAVQAFVAFLTPFGKQGIWTFMIYIAPGAAIELVMLLSRHSACCAGCASVAGGFANFVGTALVSQFILAAPMALVIFAASVGGISGALGGPIALAVLRSYWKIFPRDQPAACGTGSKFTADG